MSNYSTLFRYVLLTCNRHKIDESHGLLHAMDIFMHAHKIYESEVLQHPVLKTQEQVIYVSAILHDMCDKKYMEQDDGIREIDQFLMQPTSCVGLTMEEIKVVKTIMKTMSYSYVKQYGFPELGQYQHAYNIVREADLLCAYDFDRCMIYHMNKIGNGDIDHAFNDSITLFENRVFKHAADGLFFTDYAKLVWPEMQRNAILRIDHWRKMLGK